MFAAQEPRPSWSSMPAFGMVKATETNISTRIDARRSKGGPARIMVHGLNGRRIKVGRAVKPPELKAIEGGRDRAGRRKGAAANPAQVANPLGPPPAMLTAREKEVWSRIGHELPPGMLTIVDEYAVTAFCRAVAIADEAAEALRNPTKWAYPLKEGETRPAEPPSLLAETPNGMLVQHAYLAILNRQAVLIKALGAELGLSPAARTRISVNDDDDGNDPTSKYF